jgi:hypothetical protein
MKNPLNMVKNQGVSKNDVDERRIFLPATAGKFDFTRYRG